MTMSPTAVRTARRNLVQRIDRFVRRIRWGDHEGGTELENLDAATRSKIMFMDRDDILNLYIVTNLPIPVLDSIVSFS